MIRRLQKNGNSLALNIPPAVLELLHITPETDLHIITDGRQLFVKPARKVSERKCGADLIRALANFTPFDDPDGRELIRSLQDRQDAVPLSPWGDDD